MSCFIRFIIIQLTPYMIFMTFFARKNFYFGVPFLAIASGKTDYSRCHSFGHAWLCSFGSTKWLTLRKIWRMIFNRRIFYNSSLRIFIIWGENHPIMNGTTPTSNRKEYVSPRNCLVSCPYCGWDFVKCHFTNYCKIQNSTL